VDEADGSLVIQGWKITEEEKLAEIKETGPIPDHETVLRLPRPNGPVPHGGKSPITTASAGRRSPTAVLGARLLRAGLKM
jgi:hypothetical protein